MLDKYAKSKKVRDASYASAIEVAVVIIVNQFFVLITMHQASGLASSVAWSLSVFS